MCILIAFILGILFITINKNQQKTEEFAKTDGITMVPAFSDNINADSIWCGTFRASME